MLSKYMVTMEVEKDVIAAYSSLVGDPVFLSEAELGQVISGDITSETQNTMLHKGIYTDTEIDDLIRVRKLIEHYGKRFGHIDYVIVMMTNDCNLACDYCIGRDYYSRSYLSEDTIAAFFDLVERGGIHLEPDVEFILYGGEPLLNIKGIQYFLKRMKAIPNSRCSIVTNATFLDDLLISYLAKENVSINISIDGPKVITDAHRKFRNNTHSVFDRVQEAIDHLKKSEVAWKTSITITNELIEQKASFFSWLEKARPNAVSFNLLKLSFKPNEKQSVKSYYKAASEFLIEAHIKIMSMGITSNSLTRKIKHFVERRPVIADCVATSGNQITLNTNGDIFCCQCHLEDDNLFGNVHDGREFHTPRECIQWFDSLPIFKNACLQCAALPICGGGCLVQGKTLFQNDQYIDEGYCEHSKHIMKWILDRVYKSIHK